MIRPAAPKLIIFTGQNITAKFRTLGHLATPQKKTQSDDEF